MGASFTAFRAAVFFSDVGGLLDAEIEQQVVSASLSYRFDEMWTVQLSGGAILGGAVDIENLGRSELDPGWSVAALGRARLLSPETAHGVFVDATVAFSLAGATAGDASLLATDFRVGMVLGRRLWDVWTPYFSVRLFGGPVFWEDGAGEEISGSDRYHLSLTFGSSFALPGGVSLYVAASPVAEQAVSAGLSISFDPERVEGIEEEELPVVWGLGTSGLPE